MTDAEILRVCSRVLGDLLGDEALNLTMSTRRHQVPDWDSFTYINFIAALEIELGVKFGVADIESFADVGAIVRSVQMLKSRGT
jgi:acyl carrier protein